MVVGEKILEIIESGTWQLRHPAGLDAVPFLQWRASFTDEQWVDWGATDDNNWYQNVERDFGLNARLKDEVVLQAKMCSLQNKRTFCKERVLLHCKHTGLRNP
jgi:hypothetical protein